MIVIHGVNDPRVPYSEAEQIVDALRARGVPVELLAFPDEGHGLVKLKNRLVAYPAIVVDLSPFYSTYRTRVSLDRCTRDLCPPG
jgi:acetyl esterase/lipase